MKTSIKRIMGVTSITAIVLGAVQLSNTLFKDQDRKTIEAVEKVLTTQQWYLIEDGTAALSIHECC